MLWVAYFAVFVVAHAVGDFVLQTDQQASHKHNGLGRDPVARKALFGHLATYALPIIGALVWIGGERPVGLTVLVGVLIWLEHLIQDDGRLLAAYCKRVKGLDIVEQPGVGVWVDQSFHVLALFGAALLLTV
ncbi:MAG: DUF3307 domain-containing protein [Solirubrobacteraceae bacterium]|jgi:hypothetical protein